MNSRGIASPLAPPSPRAQSGRAAPSFTRRDIACAAPAALAISACATPATPPLTIYSPAPADNPLHALNLDFAAAAASMIAPRRIDTVAMPLPSSINQIAELPDDDKRWRLPIVATTDFRLARAGAGPDWHAYPRAHPDLRLIAKLYDVGFGVQTIDARLATPDQLRGKRIGAPPRPSAVRMLTEALLRDAWRILEHVELVDMPAREAMPALASGAIDATSWTLVAPTLGGFRPTLPAPPDARFLPISDSDLAQINARNLFQLALIEPLGARARLLSFAQALTAWDTTDNALITALLRCIERDGQRYAGLPESVTEMAAWPALQAAEVHPAARNFYASRGIHLT